MPSLVGCPTHVIDVDSCGRRSVVHAQIDLVLGSSLLDHRLAGHIGRAGDPGAGHRIGSETVAWRLTIVEGDATGRADNVGTRRYAGTANEPPSIHPRAGLDAGDRELCSRQRRSEVRVAQR